MALRVGVAELRRRQTCPPPCPSATRLPMGNRLAATVRLGSRSRPPMRRLRRAAAGRRGVGGNGGKKLKCRGRERIAVERLEKRALKGRKEKRALKERQGKRALKGRQEKRALKERQEKRALKGRSY